MPLATYLLFLVCSFLTFAAQRPTEAYSFHPQGPSRQSSLQAPPQQAIPDQELLQQKVDVHAPLTWSFPEPPVEERNFPPEFTLKEPAVAQSVRLSCGEQMVQVEVNKDLQGIGQPILASDITLGDCPPSKELMEAQLLVFYYPLHSCGSQLRITEDSCIYQFNLVYTPSAVGGSPIVRTREASIELECRYSRHQAVSSAAVNPTWSPLAATKASEESLYFSLKLMTDDWQFERPSAQYFLGDALNIEFSVSQVHHVPLKVFVDSCVATLIPNTNTVPRYSFLDNYGCLMDGMLTGSSSQILPRVQDDKLQLQLEAFRFQQDNHGVIYITCGLRATKTDEPISETSKACSFSEGWREASGFHQSCSCCGTSCGSQGPPTPLSGGQWESEKAVGPIGVRLRPGE